MARTHLTPLFAIALAAAAAMALSACSTPDSTPATSASASPATSETPSTPIPTVTETVVETPSATPTATATADAGKPVPLTCDKLITPQQMYDFNSNFSLADGYTPKTGTRAATIAGFKGLTCEWVNDSSNEKIDISVANLTEATLSGLQSKLTTTSKPVTSFGVTGFFTVEGSTGKADAFTGSYWITADSTSFTAAADAHDLVVDAVAALG